MKSLIVSFFLLSSLSTFAFDAHIKRTLKACKVTDKIVKLWIAKVHENKNEEHQYVSDILDEYVYAIVGCSIIGYRGFDKLTKDQSFHKIRAMNLVAFKMEMEFQTAPLKERKAFANLLHKISHIFTESSRSLIK